MALRKTSKILRTKTAGTSFNRHTPVRQRAHSPLSPKMRPLIFSVPELDETNTLFREAQESFQRSMPLQEFERLETIDRELLEPLRHCPVNQVVRIVVDALDRISTGAQGVSAVLPGNI